MADDNDKIYCLRVPQIKDGKEVFKTVDIAAESIPELVKTLKAAFELAKFGMPEEFANVNLLTISMLEFLQRMLFKTGDGGE